MAAATLPPDTADAFGRDFAFLRYRDATLTGDEVSISVCSNAFWSYCGPLIDPDSAPDSDTALRGNFHDFAAKTFSGPILSSLVPFLAYIRALLVSKGIHHYLLTLRASTPTDEFDRKRWHSDELFFADDGGLPGTRIGLRSNKKRLPKASFQRDYSGTNWKICTTLLGPPTLFIPAEHQSSARRLQESARQAASTDHDCQSIRCVGCASAAESVRSELDAKLARFGTRAAGRGECSVFRVGRQSGAVHSEPCMSESLEGRIFVNVIPGTEEELRSLLTKWGMEFPRQWWIGSR
ncbi:hypothetical protein ACHAQA_000705 [Verticillium albo-atrum]